MSSPPLWMDPLSRGRYIGMVPHADRRPHVSILARPFERALRKAKIEEFHFHDLRHTFAMRLVQAGIYLYKVEQLLGHKSPIMTQRYAHHYLESLRDGVAILDHPRNLAQSSTVAGESIGRVL